jgi:hypothetical protein
VASEGIETTALSIVQAPQEQVFQSPRLNMIEEEISEPIEFDPHPPGTPDRDLVTPSPPLAAGFEDISCNGPMDSKNYLSVHRKVPEILNMWYQSDQEVIVVYLFESRAYYKFSPLGGFSLRGTLQDLSRDHRFLVINEYGLGTPDMNKVYDAALEQRLVLVGKLDKPSQGIDHDGDISLDNLREYVLNYDIHTGKRKGNTEFNRITKRQKDRETSEE